MRSSEYLRVRGSASPLHNILVLEDFILLLLLHFDDLVVAFAAFTPFQLYTRTGAAGCNSEYPQTP